MRTILLSSIAISLLSISMIVGCSSSGSPSPTGQPGRQDELREIGSMLILYGGQYGKGPRKPIDLAPFQQGGPLGYQALVKGDIVVVWGATMPGEGEKGGTTDIVAYDKKTPTEGGDVLLHNGTVKHMTPDEFKSAKKAGK